MWSAWILGWRFRLAAYAGRSDVMSLYEDVEPLLFRAGRNAWAGDSFALHVTIDGLAVLGEVETAADLYDDAVESLTLGTMGAVGGLWACTTGIAAACASTWEAAETYFATALQQADELPHVMAQYETRRWWAWMLLRRGRIWGPEPRGGAARGGDRRLSEARGAVVRADRDGDAGASSDSELVDHRSPPSTQSRSRALLKARFTCEASEPVSEPT